MKPPGAKTQTPQDLWDTYDQVRGRLETQYQSPAFDPRTGLSVEALREKVDAYLSTHAAQPRIITRAAIFALLLEHGRIHIDPDDWFADHICTGGIMLDIQNRWRTECGRTIPRGFCDERRATFSNLDLSHTAPDWRNLLKYGFCGLRDRARKALQSTREPEAIEFFQAVQTVYEAAHRYLRRLAAEAERVDAVRVAHALRALADHPPQTFHEALQLSFIYNQLQEIEGEYVRSQGPFDQLYIDFYRRDLESGRLTRAQAKELIEFYFSKLQALEFSAGKNLCFGGKDRNDQDTCNELTELAFEVFAERRTIDPKFSLRVHRRVSESVLMQAAACIKQGNTAIVFANDDVAYPMFLKQGKRMADVHDFVPIGCYEPAIMGKELSCTMSTLVNLAKSIESVLEAQETPQNPGAVMARWEAQMAETLDDALAATRWWEEQWPKINPSPLLSGTMDACLEKGRDVSDAGAQYNTSGVMCAGFGTLVDSIAAIEYLVFDRQICTWQELRSALRNDWVDHETLRLTARHRAPKWGCHDERADRIALNVAQFTAQRINQTPNARGGHFQMGCWSIDHYLSMGQVTHATPDGRRKGEPISKNLGASLAMERKGVSGLIHSASKLDHTEFPDGSGLDVMLHPSMVSGEEGAKVIASLIRTYFAEGGLFVQFNLFDADTLKKAQRNPESYAHLQVRVCGWNSRFIDLSREMQDCFIADAEEKPR